MNPLAIMWTFAIIVFLVIEASTTGLISIWFALGAAASLIAAILGAPLWLQLVIFVIVSAVTVMLARPIFQKYVGPKIVGTNADRAIGQAAVITERVDNVAGTGTAVVGGVVWTVRSEAGEVIEPGAIAVIKAIDGVKLIVQKLPEHESADR